MLRKRALWTEKCESKIVPKISPEENHILSLFHKFFVHEINSWLWVARMIKFQRFTLIVGIIKIALSLLVQGRDSGMEFLDKRCPIGKQILFSSPSMPSAIIYSQLCQRVEFDNEYVIAVLLSRKWDSLGLNGDDE